MPKIIGRSVVVVVMMCGLTMASGAPMIAYTESVTQPRKPPRRVLRMGLMWALASGAVGVMVMLGFVMVTGSRPDPPFPLMFSVAGFIVGTAFALRLNLKDRMRHLGR